MIACPDVSNDYRTAIPACLNGLSGGDAWKKNLARLEVCSQKGLSERFVRASARNSPDAVCRNISTDPGRGHGGENSAGARAKPIRQLP